jgi:large subunit ribosomal protein L29
MAKDIGKIRNMTPAEMDKEELAIRDEVWKLRLQLSTGQLQDPTKVRRARKSLARLMTVRSERKLAGTKESRGD